MAQYLFQLMSGLDQRQRFEVKFAHGKAMVYVWGRQDGEGGQQDTNESERFAMAWAAYERDWLTEKVFWKPNLRDAFDNWRRDGKIDP